MISFTALDIADYHGDPLSNTFIRQEQTTQKLGVLLPGLGYTVRNPLLHYATRLLLDRGANVLLVEPDYFRKAAFGKASGEERNRWLCADADAALEAGLAQGSYEQIVLVGKSLGTRAMAHLVATDARLAQADCIWLTPLVRSGLLRRQIAQAKPRSLFAIGTADRHYDPEHYTEVVEATQGQSVVIEGANHSLEIDGDIAASIRALEQVVQAMGVFLDKDN